MKVQRNIALVIAAFALAGLLAGTAHAQEVMAKDARFTLPWRAIWADTVLPSGDYTLSVVKLSGGRGVGYSVTFAGASIKKTILVDRRPGPVVLKGSMLIAESRGDIHIIRALHLPYVDLVLTFPETKADRKLLAQAPEILQGLPILVPAK